MIRRIRSLVYRKLQRGYHKLTNPEFYRLQKEIRRLEKMPRRKKASTGLLGKTTHIIDAASFLSAYRAIFRDEIYAFDPKTSAPRIIDGGANIGLATLYWKQHFPNASIVSFEPDPLIFRVLQRNIEEHQYGDVKLVQCGLWSEETELEFQSDGADGGHVNEVSSQDATTHRVPVTRLSPYLKEQVDLLKLDIEGAEVEVLLSVAEDLKNVQRIFVEYHSYVGQEQRLDEMLSVLRNSGFRIHIMPELVADQPFIDRLESYGMDHRLNIFAYRA